MKNSLILLICFGALLSTGCFYDRMCDNLGYAVTSSIFGGMMDIPYWTDAFRDTKGRPPRDYAELCQFVKRETNSRVQLEPYTRVDFSLLPSGERQAVCYTVTDGVTNSIPMKWGKTTR